MEAAIEGLLCRTRQPKHGRACPLDPAPASLQTIPSVVPFVVRKGMHQARAPSDIRHVVAPESAGLVPLLLVTRGARLGSGDRLGRVADQPRPARNGWWRRLAFVDDLTHQETAFLADLSVPAHQFTARMPVRHKMWLWNSWSPTG